jgi:hypothetical protein
MHAPDLSVPFLSSTSGGNDFAGYHLDMARNFRIGFQVDEDGNITSLMIPDEDGPIKATRLNGFAF